MKISINEYRFEYICIQKKIDGETEIIINQYDTYNIPNFILLILLEIGFDF